MQHHSNDRGSWIWPLLLATAVFFASGRSAVASPDWIGTDKVAHFAVFGLLGILFARTQPPHRWWWGFVLAAGYGGADEWRQSFTPGRMVEVADWVADTLGAAVGVGMYVRWAGFRALLERKLVPMGSPSVAKRRVTVPPER